MRKFVLITAGGQGSRMHTNTPKQFLEIAGKPVLMHAIEAFINYDRHISLVIVLPHDKIKYWNDFCQKSLFNYPHKVVPGGLTRFHSVQNGLKHVPDDCLIAIHDGARPLVSAQAIERVFAYAEKHGNAVPCVGVKESLRIDDHGHNQPLDRSKVRIIQTPQAFHANLIKEAYEKEYNVEFTDDATLLESNGTRIHLVEGNYENIKITTPEDLIVAEALIRVRS
ncbi:MAG TPA: 2-C-methyl-D-erythritol 4-phosphate cytidylyltransferase [Bacteroidales bacterium]|nr:2-C-methyl-D-erythritol 4-phosphate cytidylyltransferase [Bacteroidales bacterium]